MERKEQAIRILGLMPDGEYKKGYLSGLNGERRRYTKGDEYKQGYKDAVSGKAPKGYTWHFFAKRTKTKATEILNIRVTKEEKQEMARVAKSKGLSLSKLIKSEIGKLCKQ